MAITLPCSFWRKKRSITLLLGAPMVRKVQFPAPCFFYFKYLPLASGQFQMAVSATNALPVGCFEAINVSGPLLNDPVYIISLSTSNNSKIICSRCRSKRYRASKNPFVRVTVVIIVTVSNASKIIARTTVNHQFSVEIGADIAGRQCYRRITVEIQLEKFSRGASVPEIAGLFLEHRSSGRRYSSDRRAWPNVERCGTATSLIKAFLNNRKFKCARVGAVPAHSDVVWRRGVGRESNSGVRECITARRVIVERHTFQREAVITSVHRHNRVHGGSYVTSSHNSGQTRRQGNSIPGDVARSRDRKSTRL